MADYSAGHITEKEAKILITFINDKLRTDSVKFYYGKSYRNLMVVTAKDQTHMKDLANLACTPPHDISGKKYSSYLPQGKGSSLLNKLMKE